MNLRKEIRKTLREFTGYDAFEYKVLRNIDLLDALFRDLTGATYPRKILIRRLNLLSAEEKDFVIKLLGKISDHTSSIEDIVSKRAEVENDPWEK